MTGRVCMVVHHYFPRDVRVRREALALAEVGWDVTVVALRQKGERARERWQDLDVVRVPVRRHRGSGLPVYLAEYLAFGAAAFGVASALHLRRRFQLVHVHTPPDFLVGAGLPARLAGAKLILDIHDLTPELYGSRFGGVGGRVMMAMLAAVERGSCALADQVITATDAFKALLVERLVPSEKILALYNCADPQVFAPRKRKAKRRKPGELVFVHHGTLMRRYGEDLLLDAFERLLEQLPHARLDIYGDGDLLPELRERALAPGLKDRVILHGEVSQEEVALALASADLAVVPNRQDTIMDLALPTKLLEALQMGCPVVASATRLLAETFASGGVRFVPPGDVHALTEAMLELGTDAEKRRALAEEGLREVRRFSWESEKRKLVDLYRGLDVSCG